MLRPADEPNLSPHWVSLLTSAGVEATHWSTVGAMNAGM